MPPSNPNRKSFSLSLNIPLTRSSSARPSKDHLSTQRSVHSPARDAFSSPLSPLLPAHLKQDQPVIPIPLADSLDPEERMRLLKKTRKLSRILGEVPIAVSINEVHDLRYTGLLEEPSTSTSASTSTSSSPGRSPPGIERQNPLKRYATVTVSHNRLAQSSEIHRARSFASLRPSLSIPSSSLNSRPSTVSPMDFAIPPIPASPVSPVSPSSRSGGSSRDTVGPDRRNSITSVSTRRNSTSSLLTHERTPEQIQRARAAKLSRQFGEDIPPDLLLRASSPPPRSRPSSPSIMSFVEASMELREPKRHAATTKRANQDAKRRLSLDVRTFVRAPALESTNRPGNASPSAPLLSDTLKHRVLLKKSNSSGRSRRPTTAGSVVDTVRSQPTMTKDSDADSDLDDDPDGQLAVEKQRALNVRRARKMNQVFGNDPPPALFQITSVPPGATDETVSVALKITDHRRRDSRATFASVAASTHSATVRESEQRPSQDSSGENLSPLVFAEPVPIPGSDMSLVDASFEGDDESVMLPYLSRNLSRSSLNDAPPTPVSLLGLSLASPSMHSIAPSIASTMSHAPSHSSHAPLPSPIREGFRLNPPPFTSKFHWSSASAPTSPPPTASPLSPASAPASATEPRAAVPQFRTRRIRAAKLSRFFGVGLNDIAGMLVTNDSTPSIATAPTPLMMPPAVMPSYKSGSAETIPTPTSPTSLRPYPSSVTESADDRAETSSRRSSSRRSRASSSGTRQSGGESRRSQSANRAQRRRPPTPVRASTSSAVDRNRSNSEPEVPRSQQQQTQTQSRQSQSSAQQELHPGQQQQQQTRNRVYSTTVEVASESRHKYLSFLDGRRPSKVKELEMHAAIKQLRKIK
ncbi:hypothetical protein C8Q80DRAFT_1265075 [Daedaleopsis nitida]|nr:hypothetical protein C8Q80DRAFT_1265075 [Daedaleopsis nitida]